MRIFYYIVILFFSVSSLIAQGVNEPGSYKQNGIGACYKTFYKAPEKLDTLIKPQGFIVHRIWRIIDLKKPESKFLFTTNYKNCEFIDLFEIIKYGLKTGTITAFNSDDFSHALQHKISLTKVLKLITLNDTIVESYFDEMGNETSSTRYFSHEIESKNLSGYVICEDWYMDEHFAKREQRIVYISPIFFNEKLQKEVPLFYLYYNECRDLFSSFKSPNVDLEIKTSYDELFLKRHFEAVVVKSSNVFNRSISDYLIGKGVEDSGNSIKDKLINEESDLFDH